MKLIGKHVTIDMYGCNFDKLNNMDFIRDAIYSAVTEANMTVIDFTFHRFEPQGLTMMALLARGHMSVHSYPELGYAAIDIMTCEEQSNPNNAIAVLRERLKPEKTRTTHIKRGDFGSERDMKPKVKVSITPLRRVRDTGAKVLRLLSRPK